jgi:voltage-gated potassium channel
MGQVPPPAPGPEGRRRRRLVARAVLRSAVTATLLFALYAVAPVDGHATAAGTALRLLLAVVCIALVLAVQVRSIVSANYPDLRAIEALVTAITVFLILFALLYLGLATTDPANFTQPLNRVGALYFTVTVLATVGFGDITAQTDGARLLVIIQMLLGLGLIAGVVRVFSAAARAGTARGADGPEPARR